MSSIDLVAVGNHLWQSTLFALAAAGLTLLLRRNSARARYLLWLSASVKFLVPFSLLTAAGALVPWSSAPVHDAPHAFLESAVHLATPVTQWTSVPDVADVASGPAQVAATGSGNVALTVLGIVWALGTLAVALRWFAQWRLIRRALREATPAGISFDVPVKVSPHQFEPGVIGILRPVLLLPRGLDERLTSGQLRAVLAHERCHVMWRDNLGALLHMIVEGLFWFHPLVWWLGARLIHERERACDERVLAEGHSPESYAEGVLKVCEHFLDSRLPCVSGISGADLRQRIKGILHGRFIQGLSGLQKAVLASAALLAIITPVATGILHSPPALARAAETLRTPLAPGPATTRSADDKRRREILETFALDSLTMVGTMKLEGKLYGLVRAPDGLVHRVLPGNYLGMHEGRITSIEPTKIIVTESFPKGPDAFVRFNTSLVLAAQPARQTGLRSLVFWDSPPPASHPLYGSISVQPDGIFIQNIPLQVLIAEAYSVMPGQLDGILYEETAGRECCKPYSIRTEGAILSGELHERIFYEPTVPDQFRPALQAFLAKEFGLVVRRSKKQVDGYVITAASGGAKLKSTGSSHPQILRFGPPGHVDAAGNPGLGVEVAGYSTREFAAILSKALFVPVVDQTGIQGNFHFDAWLPRDGSPPRAVQPAEIFAKMEEQLGLHVEAKQVTVDAIEVVSLKEPG